MGADHELRAGLAVTMADDDLLKKLMSVPWPMAVDTEPSVDSEPTKKGKVTSLGLLPDTDLIYQSAGTLSRARTFTRT